MESGVFERLRAEHLAMDSDVMSSHLDSPSDLWCTPHIPPRSPHWTCRGGKGPGASSGPAGPPGWGHTRRGHPEEAAEVLEQEQERRI